MTDISVIGTELIKESDDFIRKWDANEIELSDNANSFVFGNRNNSFTAMFGKKTDVPNHLANAISEYKRARHYANISMAKDPTLSNSISLSNGLFLRECAEMLVRVKTQLETAKMLRPGKAYYKKMDDLEQAITKKDAQIADLQKDYDQLSRKHQQLMLDFKYLEGKRDELQDKLKGMFRGETTLAKSQDRTGDEDVWDSDEKHE